MLASRRDKRGRENSGRVFVKFFDVAPILVHFSLEVGIDLCPLGVLKLLVLFAYSLAELGVGKKQFLVVNLCALLQWKIHGLTYFTLFC